MRFATLLVLLPLTTAGLPGCVSAIAESRVRGALLEAGLSERNADCMAGRMVDRLSVAQLRKLEALQGERRTLAGHEVRPDTRNPGNCVPATGVGGGHPAGVGGRYPRTMLCSGVNFLFWNSGGI